MELINYIDQIYENEKIIDYVQLVSVALGRMREDQAIEISDQQITEFSSNFGDKLHENIKLNLVVAELIRALKSESPNSKVCIYTSQRQDYVQKLLDRFGFDNTLIDKVYDRDYFDEPKPSTKNLKLICKEFGCGPQDALVVGDNVAVDLAPGAFLGMKTVLVNPSVDIAIKDVSGLKQVLQKGV